MTTSPLFKRVPVDARIYSRCPECNYTAYPDEILAPQRKHHWPHSLECVRCGYRTETKNTWDDAKAAWNKTASPESPAEEVETLRERVKELEAALAPFSLIGGPLNKVTEGVFPDDASARFLNLGELKAKHFRGAATALDRARVKGNG